MNVLMNVPLFEKALHRSVNTNAYLSFAYISAKYIIIATCKIILRRSIKLWYLSEDQCFGVIKKEHVLEMTIQTSR